MDHDPVVDELEAEEDQLRSLLASLDEAQWAAPTPAAGWSVRDQVAHLAEGEELATLAIADPDAFAGRLAELLADLDATLAAMDARAASVAPADVLARWDGARRATLAALRSHPADERIAWVSGLMSVRSFVTARLMETFAHGHDIATAIGAAVEPSARLRHVAHLGVATRRFSFANRGLAAPHGDVRVELDGPGGEQWAWGAIDATDRVRGPVLDFALVVTQRANVGDTALVVDGEGAREWLAIAQCFAGPPTDPPPPRRAT